MAELDGFLYERFQHYSQQLSVGGYYKPSDLIKILGVAGNKVGTCRKRLGFLAGELGFRDINGIKPARGKYDQRRAGWLLAAYDGDNNTNYRLSNIIETLKKLKANEDLSKSESLWGKKIEIARKRVERIIIARALSMAVSILTNSENMPADCIIVTGWGKIPYRAYCIDQINAEQLISLVSKKETDETTFRIDSYQYAITGEEPGIFYSVLNISEKELTGRQYLRLILPLTEYESMAIFIGPSQSDSSLVGQMIKKANELFGVRNDTETTTDKQTSLDANDDNSISVILKRLKSQSIYQLFKATVYDWPLVDQNLSTVKPSINEKLISEPKEAPNTVLWVFAQFLKEILQKDFALESFCDILRLPEENNDKNTLRIFASSRDDAWKPNVDRDVRLPLGQFMSGVTIIADCGLVIKDISGENTRLISRFESERKWVENRGGTFVSAITIPTINPSSAKANGTLYIGLYKTQKDNTLEKINKLEESLFYIKALALFAGELIEREKLAAHTVKTGAMLNKYEILHEEEFIQKLSEKLSELKFESYDLSARVPMILFFAMPENTVSSEITEWLSNQLVHLNIEGEIRQYIPKLKIKREDLIIGLISSPIKENPEDDTELDYTTFLAIVVPKPVMKKELKLLRELATEWDKLMSLRDEVDEMQLRVNAWILDVTCHELSLNKPEWVIINKLKKSASVVPFATKTYRLMYHQPNAMWRSAKDEAFRGMQIDPENPYLLRRFAECLLVLGSSDAEQYAELAVDKDPKHAGGLCLLGDIELSRGEIVTALKKYQAARDIDSKHPLPYYSAAYAITTVGQITRDYVVQKIREEGASIKTLKPLIHKADILLSQAREIFRYSTEFFQGWDYEARPDYAKWYFSFHNSYVKAESVLLSGSVNNAITEFEESREKYPEDESIKRGLIRARLESSAAEKLITDLDLIIKAADEINPLAGRLKIKVVPANNNESPNNKPSQRKSKLLL